MSSAFVGEKKGKKKISTAETENVGSNMTYSSDLMQC